MALTKAPEELLDKSLTSALTITTADNTTQLTLTSTDDDASIGPRMDLIRDSSSPAASDTLGGIRFMGEDDADNSLSYAHMIAYIEDPADGAEDGKFEIDTRVGGAMRSRLLIHSTSTIFNQEGQDLNFRVESNNDAHCLFVDGGNDAVGIGTGSPASPNSVNRFLHIHNSDHSSLVMSDDQNTWEIVSNNDLTIRDGTDTRLTVINGGGVSITRADNGTNLNLISTDTDANKGPILDLTRDNASAADGDVIGTIRFKADDSVNAETIYAQLNGEIVDASNGTEDGAFIIKTMKAGSLTEHVRVSELGTVGIGRSPGTGGTTDHGHDLYRSGHYYQYADASGNSDAYRLYNASGTNTAAIDADGDYHDLSDERYKENIVDASSVLDTISKMKVRSFNWKEDGRKQSYGFISQELNEVAPEAVSPPQDDEDVWGVKHAKIVPMLAKAIQEQQELIETLQTKVKALEEA